jgi:hypothetical protein
MASGQPSERPDCGAVALLGTRMIGDGRHLRASPARRGRGSSRGRAGNCAVDLFRWMKSRKRKQGILSGAAPPAAESTPRDIQSASQADDDRPPGAEHHRAQRSRKRGRNGRGIGRVDQFPRGEGASAITENRGRFPTNPRTQIRMVKTRRVILNDPQHCSDRAAARILPLRRGRNCRRPAPGGILQVDGDHRTT